MYNPQLETFLRVADAGSFNKAAEEAFITVPAVIKQINLLEEKLGLTLFVRTHKGVTLTESGNRFTVIRNTLSSTVRTLSHGQNRQGSTRRRSFASAPRRLHRRRFCSTSGRRFMSSAPILNSSSSRLKIRRRMHARF